MPRLIDADALIKATENISQNEDSPTQVAADYYQYITEAPTLTLDDIVPHGRWEDKPTGAYGRWQSWCSVCGKHSGIGGIESNRHKPYCPNCGARMRKEKENA